MKTIKKSKSTVSKTSTVNPIMQMIEDKGKIMKAIKNGEKLSTIKDIKFVSPL